MDLHNTSSFNFTEGWEVNRLRLTAFFTPGTELSDSEWWSKVTGETPETVTSKPAKGEKTQEGLFKNGKLTLHILPDRLHWSLDTIISMEEPKLTLGLLSEALDPFVQLMLHWLSFETIPPIHRLAFGANLLYFAENRRKGYEKALSFLQHIQLNPEESFDFLYQINRRRDSTLDIPNLRINRLSKWNVTEWHLQVTLDNTTTIEVERGYALRLELDINTVDEFEGDLPQEILPSLFRELVDLGTEIAEKGDIP